MKYVALQLQPQETDVWEKAMSQALDVLCQCCQQAGTLLSTLPESSRLPGQLLPQALRYASARQAIPVIIGRLIPECYTFSNESSE